MECKHEGYRVELTEDGPHYGKQVCRDCGHFLGWEPKPDNEKAKRPASHRNLVKKYGRGFCECCKRREADLPPGTVLEGHHIVEYQHGGDDSKDNVWIVCSACHRDIHHKRTWWVGLDNQWRPDTITVEASGHEVGGSYAGGSPATGPRAVGR